MGNVLTRFHELSIGVTAKFCIGGTGLSFEQVSTIVTCLAGPHLPGHTARQHHRGTHTTGCRNLHNGVTKHDYRGGGDSDEPNDSGGHVHGWRMSDKFRQRRHAVFSVLQ